ncbi:SWIM zinc finger family protein [Nocardioides sp. ChNu-153]|uniref:SWIM zinc finger family protein n=1 Tax=Nocardioides sp. ChNu-153 TaxID=2779364 RepID=UPI00264BC89E|nr:SWIM zinc finger family protein [Nocardioides sp. ChNu-153]MDN7123035.1 SWIM zinc finger family protein [Nocardioides sp. ChNu-153]
MTTTRTTHPRLAPRRAGGRQPWWAKAWTRAVEEAAFAERDLRAGQRLARAGQVGGITVGAGSVLAAVREDDDAWTVTVEVPVLADADRDALVDVVAAESGRVAALLAGDLPHRLVEDAEELGVELLPYGGEFAATCTCPHALDPCAHALAVLVQVGWLVADDPLVLLALRGLDRETLLARLHARTGGAGDGPGGDAPAGEDPDALDVAADAALRAARLLREIEAGRVPESW